MVREDRKPNTLIEAVRYFDPETAQRYVERIKWPEGPVCPQCGSFNVGRIASRNRCQCREKGCRKQFSLTTGTIFEASHISLDKWMIAVWQLVNCRNAISSCEIARALGIKQQSAWHVLHRLREVMKPADADQLSGVVEADSTLIGGLLQNMPASRRNKLNFTGPTTGKTRVHALRERSTGRLRAAVIDGYKYFSEKNHVTENVEPGSMLYTDAAALYRNFKGMYVHEYVNHKKGEYVRDGVSTNGCESFFNVLRRAIIGTYCHAAPEHLEAYVNEAVHRYNVRHESEWDRFESAMKRVVGKRLTYSELTDGAKR